MPVGVPVPGATMLTAAVKVTAWPNWDGFADELSAVVEPVDFAWCGYIPGPMIAPGGSGGAAAGRRRWYAAMIVGLIFFISS